MIRRDYIRLFHNDNTMGRRIGVQEYLIIILCLNIQFSKAVTIIIYKSTIHDRGQVQK